MPQLQLTAWSALLVSGAALRVLLLLVVIVTPAISVREG